MKKDDFEKLRSVVEKKKLFQALIGAPEGILVKFEPDSLLEVRPDRFGDNDSLWGSVQWLTGEKNKGPQPCIGQFGVSSDRYFFKTELCFSDDKGERVELKLPEEIFKLQRRASFRVSIPPSFPLSMNLTEVNGQPVLTEVRIFDISAGGVRISLKKTDPALPMNALIKGTLHPPNGRSMNIAGLVRHAQATVVGLEPVVQYGCEFQFLEGVYKNRLLSLTLDLQHRIITSGHS